MEPKEPFRQRQPVIAAAALVGLVQNGITLAVSFGLKLDPTQTGAILSFTNSTALVLGMVWTRSKVEPS